MLPRGRQDREKPLCLENMVRRGKSPLDSRLRRVIAFRVRTSYRLSDMRRGCRPVR